MLVGRGAAAEAAWDGIEDLGTSAYVTKMRAEATNPKTETASRSRSSFRKGLPPSGCDAGP